MVSFCPPLHRHAPTALVLLLLLIAAAPEAPAGERPAGPTAVAAMPVPYAPLPADGWTWNGVYHSVVEYNLSSRAGLLRIGLIGMFLALLIIMCNKWNKW